MDAFTRPTTRAPIPDSAPTTELGLVLIGPPGVGKGTQAARLRTEFALRHIATGDLLREDRAQDTELGRKATEHMASGHLVPDQLVVAMVEERIRETRRFLLDGFPRTLPQSLLHLAGADRTPAALVRAAELPE